MKAFIDRIAKCNVLRLLVGLALASLMALPGMAQGGGTAPASAPEEVTFGAYRVSQSFEFGGRIADYNGNEDVWNTFVNLHSGPRLLEQTLSLDAQAGAGLLFDHLYMSSFGYGGDPNNVSAVRISKDRWYSFAGTFRRDQNYWDYNLLANPLNVGPTGTTNPATFFTPSEYNVSNSPHSMYTVRRMTDLALTLAPKSVLSFRLGFNHYAYEGPSFITYHEGADPRQFQDVRTKVDNYTIGADWKMAPRTKLSYTQFLNWFKNDTAYSLTDLNYILPNGVTVNPGITMEGTQPCSTPFGTAGGGTGTRATDPDTLNPTCSGYTSYTRVQPVRRMFPTEQLSFQSNYWKRFSIVASGAYNSMDVDVDGFSELFGGLVSRTRQRAYDISGPVNNQRISATADLTTSFRITDNLTLSNTFRWHNYRVSGEFDMTELSLFGTNMTVAPNVFSPAACPAPYTAATCPQHANSSPADVISELIRGKENDDQRINTLALTYSFGKLGGVTGGYRFRRQFLVVGRSEEITSTIYPGGVLVTARPRPGGTTDTCATAGATDADGVCTLTGISEDEEEFKVNQHTALAGFWVRPMDDLRLSADLEYMTGDPGWHRMYATKAQRYKFRAQYRPQQWLSLNGGASLFEGSTDAEDIDSDRHNRNFNVNANFSRSENFAFDAGYNFGDIGTATNICYIATGVVPPGATTACADRTDSYWTSDQHFVNLAITYKPVKRVQASVGYNLSMVDGDALLTHPAMPLGLVKYTYQSPSAMLGIGLTDRWMFKTAWNHYGFNEDEDLRGSQFAGRDMDGNVVTLSLRYAF